MHDLWEKNLVLAPAGMAVLLEENEQSDKSHNAGACKIYYTKISGELDDYDKQIGDALKKLDALAEGEAFVLNVYAGGHWVPIKFEKGNNQNHVIIMDSTGTNILGKSLSIKEWSEGNEFMMAIKRVAGNTALGKRTRVYCNTFLIQADGSNCGIFSYKTAKKMARMPELHKIITQAKYQGNFKQKAKEKILDKDIIVQGFIIPENMVGLAQFHTRADRKEAVQNIYKERIGYKPNEKIKLGDAERTLDQYWIKRAPAPGTFGEAEDKSTKIEPVTYFLRKYMKHLKEVTEKPNAETFVHNAETNHRIENLLK